MQDITLRQLRAITAVAETGKIISAAKALHVTAPAVTMQIKQVEDSIGMPMFERSDGLLRPTDAGAALVRTASRVEAELRDCAEALADLTGLKHGSVSVGVVSTAKYFAPRMLAAFAQTYPSISLRLAVANRSETLAALEDHRFDVFIMGRPPTQMAVEAQEIGHHPYVFIAPVDHPLARRKRLQLSDLALETMLVREPGSGTRILMERLFTEATFEPKIGMEIASNETIKQSVMAGLGLSLLSAHTVAAEIQSGQLAMLPLPGLPIWRKWFVVRPATKRLLPADRTLWTFLADSGAQFLPEIPGLTSPEDRTA